MQITIKGKHIAVGDALRSHAEQSLHLLVSKFFDKAIDATVVLSREAHNFRVDITVHPFRGVTVKGSGVASEAYAAFDAATNRIERQLRRYKGRFFDHKTKGEVVAAQYAIIAAQEEDNEDSPVEHTPIIIAEMSAEVPVCSVSGAVMRLDLANATAVLFRNSVHGRLNMVYRRPDGNIGWVDPKDHHL
ncbi:Ribosomal subunit interface protein [invertebrate metagenome]|uniref:Ribosomal subunit interface protein n=1 Tax=invertebrate metagenome TaxID=1711999 RepID=A0A484H846_9ZZZZ